MTVRLNFCWFGEQHADFAWVLQVKSAKPVLMRYPRDDRPGALLGSRPSRRGLNWYRGAGHADRSCRCGHIGSETAYHLAAAGAEVVLVDDVAQGRATAAGAGIVCPWPSLIEDPAWYMLASLGARYYPELIALLAEAGQTDVSYRKTGAMIVAGEAELDQVERRVRGELRPRQRLARSPLDPAGSAGSFPALAQGQSRSSYRGRRPGGRRGARQGDVARRRCG